MLPDELSRRHFLLLLPKGKVWDGKRGIFVCLGVLGGVGLFWGFFPFLEVHQQGWIPIAIILPFWTSHRELMDSAWQSIPADALKKSEVKFSNNEVVPESILIQKGCFGTQSWLWK